MDLSKFKNIFISEVNDHLQKLNDNLLIFEKSIQQENINESEVLDILNELMRSSHTIKGSSASMGYNQTAFLSHVMEDVFDGARHGTFEVGDDVMNALFECIDILEKSIESIKNKDKEVDCDEISKKLKAITGVQTEGVGKSNRNPEKQNSTGGLKIKTKEKSGKQDNEIKKNNQKSSAELSKEIEKSIKSTKIDYIKVPVKRLDYLLDLVEELLIDKMKLDQISQKSPALKELTSHINLLISGIQHEIMQARLVPVEQIYARFPRMVRDLSQSQKKNIDFQIIGSEIELDRTVVDKLGEPLIHLLRNAIDHGVEKSGVIKLETIRKGENVLIIVENTGNGIDLVKVKEVAIKRGLIGSKDANHLKEDDIMELLFNPNLSTSEKVTEISGRGVGLSVVKQFIESFGGRIIVSNLEEGVRFTLELPLTLAIINSLLIEVNNFIYAIPYSNVVRSVIVLDENIKKLADKDMALIDGDNIPILNLKNSFKLRNKYYENYIKSETENKKRKIRIKGTLMVLVKKENEIVGLVVDKLVNEQEIIVKPFTSVLQSIKSFSGSTILGDGRVSLIIDIFSLLKNN